MAILVQVEPESNCFEASQYPSCQDSICAARVCENEGYEYCCSTMWDFYCIEASCSICENTGQNDSCNALGDPKPITVTIRTDLYGEETLWQLSEETYSGGEILLEGGPYEARPGTYVLSETLFSSCFEFLLVDTQSDGGAEATIDFMGKTYTVGPDYEAFISVLIGDCG